MRTLKIAHIIIDEFQTASVWTEKNQYRINRANMIVCFLFAEGASPEIEVMSIERSRPFNITSEKMEKYKSQGVPADQGCPIL